MSYVMRPHDLIAKPAQLGWMLDECNPREWVLVFPDGSWWGPYPDVDSALKAQQETLTAA